MKEKLNEDIKDVERFFKHYNILYKPENNESVSRKITDMMIHKMEKCIETHNKLKEKEIKKMRTEINSKVEYSELYHSLSNLFLTSPIPKELLKTYLYGDEDERMTAELEMIEFIAGNLKDEIAFSTSFPIMDAIESIIDSNVQSGNIQLIGVDELK